MAMIIGFSGKKQAGKSTCANFTLGTLMWTKGIIEGSYMINPEGKLVVTDLFGNKDLTGIVDLEANVPGQEQFFTDNGVFDFCQLYSYAQPLKRLCVEMLGLNPEYVSGTNNQKDMPTDFLWENMPLGNSGRTGPMTIREMLQYAGGYLRLLDANIFVRALINKIEKDDSDFAIIHDVRFQNEVEAIQAIGGIVVRLTRCPYEDNDISETDLDEYDGFDFYIDNSKMSIAEQNNAVMQVLSQSGVKVCT